VLEAWLTFSADSEEELLAALQELEELEEQVGLLAF
jgi:hypothetical protein